MAPPTFRRFISSGNSNFQGDTSRKKTDICKWVYLTDWKEKGEEHPGRDQSISMR